jgi:general secretion pathway protein G
MVTRLRGRSGHTLIEMVVTISVMAIFASVILPLAAVTRKREKELELRRNLREIRTALDLYHELCLNSMGGQRPPAGGGQNGQPMQALTLKIEDNLGGICFPKDLDPLVEGVDTATPDYKLRFLRRIPRDPFNVGNDEHDGYGWIFRSTTDDPEKQGGWNRQNVFDVRSASESQALDGSYYKDW